MTYRPVLIAGLLFAVTLTKLADISAAEQKYPITPISIIDQNEMIESYCVMCHLDSVNNGGLSLERFDAGTVSPALAAILASKFTTGMPLKHLVAPPADPEVIEEIELGKRYGAPSVMDVAGLPLPPDGEINGFIMSMAKSAEGAEVWYVKKNNASIQADIARIASLPRREDQGPRDVTYRLILTCNLENRESDLLLTWSPIPSNGTLKVVIDDNPEVEFELNEQEPMANGDDGTSAPSSVLLIGAAKNQSYPTVSMPRNSLKFQGPLPFRTEQLEVPFDDLWGSQPQLSEACLN